jgi:3-isopropylmalate dehydrogenase
MGAVGGPKWDDLPGGLRPEAGLLSIRAGLGVYANLRPAKLFPELASSCPLRSAVVEGGFDVLIVRELTGGSIRGPVQDHQRRGSLVYERYSKSEIPAFCPRLSGPPGAVGRSSVW